ncbi:MAG: hypothetical protein AAFZ52_05120 [Bacteroidota bacterium]
MMERLYSSLKTPLLLLFVFLSVPPLSAQEEARALTTEDWEYLVETSRAIDPLRYEEVRGTPYRYKNFRPGVLYDLTLNVFHLDSVNFNGFTSQFEYRLDGQTREFNPQNYLRVEIPLEEDGKHVYGRGINPRFRDKYAEIVYKGENLVSTLVYVVENEEKVVQDVGKTLRLRRFNPKSMHYAVVDGEYVALKMSAKNLASDLGFKSELLKFIKANKLKPAKRADLVRIYAEADRLIDG